MANYVRKLVSGNKARFRDEELDLDLDLVYVTDQLIIMGFPAGGLEGFYRNRREDAKKFLDHRHQDNYWVFNFCPLAENSYDATVFGGRVSRYPFPDHHAPPLAIFALVAREMRVWLEGSTERVAVLHCKAGKGRSGTLACAYLLSLDISPEPPHLQRSYTAKQWAKLRAEEWMNVVETDDMPKDDSVLNPATDHSDDTRSAPMESNTSLDINSSETSISHAQPTESNLEKVLALHTSRRMKPPSSSSSSLSSSTPKKPKQGVSIPSQRRFLLYWSMLLSNTAPPYFWPAISADRPKVRLQKITVRLREASGAKMTIVKVVNKVLDNTVSTKGGRQTYGQGMGNLWISLARYNDDFVQFLEDWENSTRDEQGHLGKRNEGHTGEGVTKIFNDGKWDNGKMVRSFARFGRVEKDIDVQNYDQKSRIYTHVLTPLNQSHWTVVKKAIKANPTPAASKIPEEIKGENEEASFDATDQIAIPDDNIVLDAGREVRAKLYLGQVFMGWLWFIPAFHMTQPPPRTTDEAPSPVHFRLGRKDVDFPLGIGAWIVDIDIEMAWVAIESQASYDPPPQRQ
ncbi:phosphatases II [Ramaria rubella]|nr:phosphatases II [Ramaria rubella]